MKIEACKLDGINVIDAKVDNSTVSVLDMVEIESYIDKHIIEPAKRVGLTVRRAKAPVCYTDCIAHLTVEGEVSRMSGYFHEMYLVFLHKKEGEDHDT